MADESQSEAIGREVRTLSNKQVELFDRLRDVEQRLDMLHKERNPCLGQGCN